MPEPIDADTQNAMMAAMVIEARRLSAVGASMTGAAEVIKAAGLSKLQKWLLAGLLVLTTIGAVSASVDGLFILSGQHASHRIQRQIQKATDNINDCTMPTGTCYLRGRAATATAIEQLQKYTLIAVECAHSGGTDQVIEACVLAKSRQQGLIK